MEPNLRSRISLRSIRATKRRNCETEERKPGPPLIFFYPDRFRASRDHVSASARSICASRAEKTRAPRRARERERLAVKILPRPRLQHRLDRDMRPRRNLVAERHVGIVHLARLVALGGKLADQ